jgi:hypothetical protein
VSPFSIYHPFHSYTYNLHNLLRLINQPLNFKPTISPRKLPQQLPPSLPFHTLHIELLHAHDQPPRLVHTDALILHYRALPQHQVMAVRKLLMKRDRGVRTRKLAAQLEFRERCEEKCCGRHVWVRELQVVQLSGLLGRRGGVGVLGGDFAWHGEDEGGVRLCGREERAEDGARDGEVNGLRIAGVAQAPEGLHFLVGEVADFGQVEEGVQGLDAGWGFGR